MDKLARYNQRILAVGGTLLLLVALFSCLFMGYELYDQWWRRGNREADTRMIANREAEELKAYQSLRNGFRGLASTGCFYGRNRR